MVIVKLVVAAWGGAAVQPADIEGCLQLQAASLYAKQVIGDADEELPHSCYLILISRSLETYIQQPNPITKLSECISGWESMMILLRGSIRSDLAL